MEFSPPLSQQDGTLAAESRMLHSVCVATHECHVSWRWEACSTVGNVSATNGTSPLNITEISP